MRPEQPAEPEEPGYDEPGEYTETAEQVVPDDEAEAIPPAAAERAREAEEFGGSVDDEIRVPPDLDS